MPSSRGRRLARPAGTGALPDPGDRGCPGRGRPAGHVARDGRAHTGRQTRRHPGGVAPQRKNREYLSLKSVGKNERRKIEIP